MKLLAVLTLSSVILLNNLGLVLAKNDVMDANSKKIISWYKGINQSKVVIAINCGGTEDHKDADGLVYKADTKLAKGG